MHAGDRGGPRRPYRLGPARDFISDPNFARREKRFILWGVNYFGMEEYHQYSYLVFAQGVKNRSIPDIRSYLKVGQFRLMSRRAQRLITDNSTANSSRQS
jgi:hypothetical protein